jgi:ABC-type phosphate transport system permease subunit
MLGLALLSLVAADRAVLDDHPAATSFVTEKPTDPPSGLAGGIGGAILTAFLLSLIGLGVAIATSLFIIRPLVDSHYEPIEGEQALTKLDALGD